MKVYTYYENINFEHQNELLKIWKNSWERNGFEPKILSRFDAENHYFYKEYVKRLEDIHFKLTDRPITAYGLSCWLRWIAYATQPEEKFYVCDYDVINHSFSPVEPSNYLHLMDWDCPCIASGTPLQFLDLCKKIVNFTEDNLRQFKEKLHDLFNRFNDNGQHKIQIPQFHDQEFFIIYKLLDKTGIFMTRERTKFLGIPAEGNFWEKQLVHYAFALCVKYCNQNNFTYNKHEAKCITIKRHLKL